MSNPRAPLTKTEQAGLEKIAASLKQARPYSEAEHLERDQIHLHIKKTAGMLVEESNPVLSKQEQQKQDETHAQAEQINAGVQKMLIRNELIEKMRKEISPSITVSSNVEMQLSVNQEVLAKLEKDYLTIQQFVTEQIRSELLEHKVNLIADLKKSSDQTTATQEKIKSLEQEISTQQLTMAAEQKSAAYFQKVKATAAHNIDVPVTSNSNALPQVQQLDAQKVLLQTRLAEMQIMLSSIQKNVRQARIPLTPEISSLATNLLERRFITDKDGTQIDLKSRQAEEKKKIEDYRQELAAKIRKGEIAGEEKVEKTSYSLESVSTMADASDRIGHSVAALGWVDQFLGVISLPVKAYNMVQGLLDKKDHPANRIEKVLYGALGIGLGIASMVGVVVAAPIWLVVSIAKDAKDSVQALGKAQENISQRIPILENEIAEKNTRFYQLAMRGDNLKKLESYRKNQDSSGFTPEQRRLVTLDRDLTSAKNDILELRAERANASHAVAKSIFAVTALVLSFLVPPVGIGMLIASGGYNTLDATGLNPFKRLAQGIRKLLGKNSNPYALQAHHESISTIERNVSVLKTSLGQTATTPSVAVTNTYQPPSVTIPSQPSNAQTLSSAPIIPQAISPSVASFMKELNGDAVQAKSALMSDIETLHAVPVEAPARESNTSPSVEPTRPLELEADTKNDTEEDSEDTDVSEDRTHRFNE